MDERRRVLIVDDEGAIRSFVASLLADELGTPVLESASADEACVLIERERPRLVLLDLTLPGTDGIDCIRRVRTEMTGWTSAIVAMSASPERAAEALEAGADAFLGKPFVLDHLLEIVRQWIPSRGCGNRPAPG